MCEAGQLRACALARTPSAQNSSFALEFLGRRGLNRSSSIAVHPSRKEMAGLRLASLAARTRLAKNPSPAARIFRVSWVEPRFQALSPLGAKKAPTPLGSMLFWCARREATGYRPRTHSVSPKFFVRSRIFGTSWVESQFFYCSSPFEERNGGTATRFARCTHSTC